MCVSKSKIKWRRERKERTRAHIILEHQIMLAGISRADQMTNGRLVRHAAAERAAKAVIVQVWYVEAFATRGDLRRIGYCSVPSSDDRAGELRAAQHLLHVRVPLERALKANIIHLGKDRMVDGRRL